MYNRRGIIAGYSETCTTERVSPEELIALQEMKLRAVINYSARNVPYYRELFARAGVRPETFDGLTDLKRIPPLSRQDLVDNRERLIDSRYIGSANRLNDRLCVPGEPMLFSRFHRYPLVKNTSSGSTGAPTVFYENGVVSATSWSNELRVKCWFGVNPGIREVRLVRLSPDFVINSRANRMRQLLWNQLVMPGVNLTDKEYELIIEELHRFNPKTIWAFTSAIAGLARYVNENHLSIDSCRPSLVMTWAAPLYENEHEAIKKAFSCAVTNIYGMREVGHIGAFCPAGSLHVFQETHLLETDSNGELLVTFLKPSPMPFIRYRTGDVGELATLRCACGRNLQIIERFHGRTGEIFITENGKMFSPNFWCRTFMDAVLAQTVKRFQVIYTKDGVIRIKLVANPTHR
ncbi:MAG TPA: hypothetical protein VHO70_22315, partial [Chitinispirillaceae bacterium]|nr:hypothetical protein [Chitinispirillaceae bacterium]